jgi:hypothetical protein
MPRVHVVAQGDCMSSLAKRYGFRSYKTIYDDADNADLKQKRSDPNILFPGDRVVIPDKDGRVEEKPTGARHRFVVETTPTFVRLQIDTDRELAYRLQIDGREPIEGKTDGSDVIAHEIEADARAANITLWPATLEDKRDDNGVAIPLRLGALDPLEEVAGVQGRLLNLAFFAGAIDNQESAPTTEAIKAFERFLGRPVKGELTDALRAELAARHHS